MAISVRCVNPECGKPLRVKDEFAGRRVKCPGCGRQLTVPARESAPAEEPAPRVGPPAGRAAAPQPPAGRAVWPWLAGMAAMLLAGAGGGYLLSASLAKPGGDHPARPDAAPQESARAADLAKQLAAAEERAKEASAAATAELGDLRARLRAADAELATLKAANSPPPAAGAGDPGQGDGARLQGTWVLVAKDLAADFRLEIVKDKLRVTVTFAGDKLVLAEQRTGETKRTEGRFVLRPGSSPKEMDFVPADAGWTGDGMLGVHGTQWIYELDADKLRICAHPEGKGRPKEMKPLGRIQVLHYEREKP
ncbi:MAG: hypothetical protein C0501_25855 [Isosphaera sp.]|nr:hypothetical protein [Isosphaera sp.]